MLEIYLNLLFCISLMIVIFSTTQDLAILCGRNINYPDILGQPLLSWYFLYPAYIYQIYIWTSYFGLLPYG